MKYKILAKFPTSEKLVVMLETFDKFQADMSLEMNRLMFPRVTFTMDKS